MIIEHYELSQSELLQHANAVFINTINSLESEKFITPEQCLDIQRNYSIILENPSWMPKFLTDWLNLKGKVQWRMVRAINRQKDCAEVVK